MEINITGHHLAVTPALRQLTLEKFKRLEKHFHNITAIHIIFMIERNTHTAKATLLITKGEIHAEAVSDDLYAAVDDLIAKIDTQLIKHKEKLKDH